MSWNGILLQRVAEGRSGKETPCVTKHQVLLNSNLYYAFILRLAIWDTQQSGHSAKKIMYMGGIRYPSSSIVAYIGSLVLSLHY